jgi:hypothetical protein
MPDVTPEFLWQAIYEKNLCGRLLRLQQTVLLLQYPLNAT